MENQTLLSRFKNAWNVFLMEKFYGMRQKHFNNKLEKDRNKTS